MKYKKGLSYIKIRLLLFLYFSIIFIILKYVFLNYLFIISLSQSQQMECILFIQWLHRTARKMPFSTIAGDQNMVYSTQINFVRYLLPVFLPCQKKPAHRETQFPLNLHVGQDISCAKRTITSFSKRETERNFSVGKSFAFRSRPRGVVLPKISYDMQACACPNGTVFVTKMGIAFAHYSLSKYEYGFKWNHEDV